MEKHQMVLQKTFPDGSQEWVCPVCGRHFIMQWPPNYKRVILKEGNLLAFHSGGTGGLVMGSAEIQPAVSGEDREEVDYPADFDDPYLTPFTRWLQDNHKLND